MFKRLVRSPAVMAGFGALVWVYMVVLSRTLRWRIEGAEHARELWFSKGPFVLVTWHSRIMLMPVIQLNLRKGWPERPHRLTVMVSASRDGEITQQTAKLLDLHVIRASAAKKNSNKDKRSFQGAREAMSVMQKGACLCATVDGPRGPPEVMNMGVVKLAQQMGAPILVYGLSANAPRMRTWDRLLFPAPFARASVVFEAPIAASKDMDSEALRLLVENRLKAVVARADTLSGLAPDQLVRTTAASPVETGSPDAALGQGGP
jgi:lysophospholipid acyltransferase (LPLAT)-like uncharacterized protein